MFGSNTTGFFGTDHFALSHATSWDYTLLLFQTMFAATAATIVSGALAERIRYWPYIVAAMLITAFIYPIYGSWAWGSTYNGTGWLKELGFIDFAGSTVVHSIGGWCALAGVLVLGPRLGRFEKKRAKITQSRRIEGHNLPIVALGAFILWFGWFGFNGGSTLEANTDIGRIILNTHLAGSAGVFGAICILVLARQPIFLTGAINGGLGGLVAICANCAYVEPPFAIVTGLVAGIIVIFGTVLLNKLRLDDAVGAVAVHAFSGTWGALAVGLFHKDHFFDLKQLTIQAIGAGVAFLWAFPMAWIMFKMLSLIVKVRVKTSDERKGLDYTEHDEIAYPEFQQHLLHSGRD